MPKDRGIHPCPGKRHQTHASRPLSRPRTTSSRPRANRVRRGATKHTTKSHNTPPYAPRVAGREFGALPPPSLSFCASSFRIIFCRAASNEAFKFTVRRRSSSSSKSDLTAFDKGFSATHSSWGSAASLTLRAAAPSRFVVATAVAWFVVRRCVVFLLCD